MHILSVENLSKKYHREPFAGRKAGSFRELVSKSLRGLVAGGSGGGKAAAAHEFWALRDLSFQLEEGTRLGVIGRNGAGKSTLLKVLSRITEPTTGRISIFGRTASLLEIGTGFHPELTGRENIYLNGALLGMGRSEVQRKLDQIIDFAEIEEFLDEPVKHYSSGMYVRLAFAIAAHVDPDILILDEVLAVGDLEFQRKCFGKMQELGQAARSVIFVSHDLAAVSSLCNRCMVLDGGRIVFDGSAAEGVLKYYEQGPQARNSLDFQSAHRVIGDQDARLLAAEVTDESGSPIIEAAISQLVKVSMRYRISSEGRAPAVPNFWFYRVDGTCAFVAVAPDVQAEGPGDFVARVDVPGKLLNEGVYRIGLALTTFQSGQPKVHFNEQGALILNVRDPREPGTLRYGFAGEFPGAIRPHFNWTIKRASS